MQNLVQISKNYTSRSAVLTMKVCPYKRFLQYELEGSGYTIEKISLDLLIGTCVHRGLQHLLEHCRLEHPDGSFEEACIDQAVAEAYKVWQNTLSNHQLWLHSGEEDRLDWIIAEQECLFEGLIRAFVARRLPAFLEEYEILEVEHEEVYEDFTPAQKCPSCEGIGYHSTKEENIKCEKCNGKGLIHSIIFLGKADGLLRRKIDNKLVILSIKTASQYADVTTRDILHDMQGVSEWAIVADRINKAWNYWELLDTKATNTDIIYPDNELEFLVKYDWFKNFQTKPEIFAVQYEYLLKGQRKQDPYGSGIYKQNSFLCHPYKLDAIQQIFIGSNVGSVINPAEYKWKTGKGKQPKGWEKADVWNDIGIRNWINMLATGQVQAEEGQAFDEILITPDLVVRDANEIKEWLVSTRFQEENIVKGLNIIKGLETLRVKALENTPNIANYVNNNYDQQIQEAIWCYFPKNTLSCHNYYGKDCPYVIHCHELSSLEDLIASGYLIPRESHHELEREELAKLNK